jgi:phosphatidate cytidylyltransferase
MALSSLVQRVVTAAVLVPLVVAALFLLPPRAFAIAMLGVIALAAHEWSKLAGFGLQRMASFVGGFVLLAAFVLFSSAFGFERGWPERVVVTICGVATVFWVAIAPPWLARQWTTRAWMPATLVGWVVLLGAWVAVVELQARSPWLLLAAMATVWIADTAAYFTGRRFGRRKLAPSISPNKTWEGVFGALAAVGAYALLLVVLEVDVVAGGERGAAFAMAFVLFGLLLAAVSIAGDLFESLLKRQAGAKDSGTLLPGHGGVLDRIDALLSAMPPAAIAAALVLPKGA